MGLCETFTIIIIRSSIFIIELNKSVYFGRETC